MKIRIKSLLLMTLTLVILMLITSCAFERSPYETYDEEGYTVSVKYDANGGSFTTNTTVIVDTYSLSDAKADASGNRSVALLTPDDQVRGVGNYFSATKSGYFLAGWYTEKTPVLDENGQQVTYGDGSAAYTYSGRWDFESDRLVIDESKQYTATEPAVTLYAAWVPEFSFVFCDMQSGEVLQTKKFNPLYSNEIRLPEWNTSTGKLDMNDFPAISGKTFDGAYLDNAGKSRITTETVTHVGSCDLTTATAISPEMKIYVDAIDGEWFHVYTAEQLANNASVVGNYNICADLDFSEVAWPSSFMHGSFGGKILGNGHSISNVTTTQTNTSKLYTGLFGQIAAEAVIENVTFDNATVVIEKGTLKSGARMGLFAGTVAEGSTLSGLTLTNSVLKIDSECALPPTDYEIGLFCGIGDCDGIDLSGISCEAIDHEDSIYRLVITVDGNSVSVSREDNVSED